MKTKLILTIFISLFGLSTFVNNSYAQWVVQDVSSITTNSFNSVYFSDILNGWVGGANGTIIHTSDGGMNWALQNSGANGNIGDISFIDSLNGWAVSNSGEVLKTDNSGANWAKQYLTGNFIFIHFFDTLYGLTGNRDGIIYKTLDGGQNWIAMSGSVPPSTFHDIFALDSIHAWGVGNTCIYKYNGTNWTQTYYNGNDDFYSVFFLDSLKGWAVGAYGIIRNTIDGGYTWDPQPSGWSSGYFFSVYFTDSLNGWTVGDYGKILKYDGANWLNQNSNINQMLSAVHFSNNNHGWATSWGGKLIHTDTYTNVSENINFNFSIFPNPFSTQTTLQTDHFFRNATLTVDNCFGQTVKQIKNISGQTVILSRDNLPSGLYFIRLTEDSKVIATKKILITD